MTNFHPGYLEQGNPLGMTVKNVMLNADNLRVDVSGIGLLYLSSDNTTATNRTFVMTASTLVGHQLVIIFASGSSTTCELADSGTCKLNGAWTPVQYDSLVLVSNGTSWIETARSYTGQTTSIPLTNTHIFVGNGSGIATDVAMSGDATIANTGAVTIANSAVTNAKVDAAAAISFSKLAALTSGNILVGSAGNVATSVTPSGDVTVTNAGVTAIGANKVTVAMLNSAVMVEATGTLTQADIIALNSVPKVLIADPGAGVALIVDEIELLHTYSTSQYTGGDDLQIEYSDGTDIVLVDKTIITNASSTSRVIRPTIYNLDASTGTGLGWAIVAAKGVRATCATADFGAGNVANIVKWRVRYHLVTLLT